MIKSRISQMVRTLPPNNSPMIPPISPAVENELLQMFVVGNDRDRLVSPTKLLIRFTSDSYGSDFILPGGDNSFVVNIRPLSPF